MNNINFILPLLHFDVKGSYHIQVLQRSKDGHDKATRYICDWYISSEDKLLFLMPAIEALCSKYNARCYINLNVKSDKDVCWNLLQSSMENIKNENYAPIGLLRHSHDSCQGVFKYWIVDVDDPDVNLDDLTKSVDCCDSKFNPNVISRIPTKNGTHLITHPFNLKQLNLPNGVEVKKNASTLLYCI